MSKATPKATPAAAAASTDTAAANTTQEQAAPASAALPPAVIKPTIGRRVWYWPSETERTADPHAGNHIAQPDPTQACDAGIAYVWSDVMVNLTVADHNGKLHARTSVRLLQPGEPAPADGGFAEWMPYQQGQAKAAA